MREVRVVYVQVTKRNVTCQVVPAPAGTHEYAPTQCAPCRHTRMHASIHTHATHTHRTTSTRRFLDAESPTRAQQTSPRSENESKNKKNGKQTNLFRFVLFSPLPFEFARRSAAEGEEEGAEGAEGQIVSKQTKQNVSSCQLPMHELNEQTTRLLLPLCVCLFVCLFCFVFVLLFCFLVVALFSFVLLHVAAPV